MQISTIKIGRLATILSGKLSKEIALSILKDGKFSNREDQLVKVLIRILEAGDEISATQIWLHSLNKDLLLYYMEYIDAMDRRHL